MALAFYQSSDDPVHHARIMLALAYLAGERDDEPLNGVMVRLLLTSVVSEYEAELEKRQHAAS